MSKYVNEVLDGPRLYDVKTEDGLTTLFSKVQMVKNYTPLVEGSNFGAKDANHFDNMITALSIDNTKIRLELELAKLDGVGFYDTFEDLDDVNESLTNADVDTSAMNVTFNVATYNITSIADYTAQTTIRTEEEPAQGDKIDNTNEILTVTEVDDSTTIDKSTPFTIVSSAVSTEGNGGRKTFYHDGFEYTSVKDNDNVKIYKTDISLETTILLYTSTSNANLKDWSMCFDGVNIHMVRAMGGLGVITYNSIDLDGVQQSATNLGAGSITESFEISISLSDDLSKIVFAYSATNASYPSSKNIYAFQGTDSNGVVTWGSVEQWTSHNSSGFDFGSPTTIYNNGFPYCVSILKANTNYTVYILSPNPTLGTAAGIFNVPFVNIKSAGAYIQSNPSLDKLSTGELIVAWTGSDSGDAQTQVRFSQSTDTTGTAWGSVEKLTTGADARQKVSITRDKNDLIHIVYQGVVSGYWKVLQLSGTSGVFSSEQPLSLLSFTGTPSPSTVNNFRDFEKPLTVYSDNVLADVKFYGKWTVGSIVYELGLESPVTVLEGGTIEVYPGDYPYETLTMVERTFKINAETVTTVLYLSSGSSIDFEVYVNDVQATLLYDEELELTYQIENVDSADIIIKANGSNSAVLDNLLFAIS